MLDGTARRCVDQSACFGSDGQGQDPLLHRSRSGAKPLKVTLAWTDAPGPTIGNSFVNDLDLEVTAGGNIYKGNVLVGRRSRWRAARADPRNNVENVFLPAGATGTVQGRA